MAPVANPDPGEIPRPAPAAGRTIPAKGTVRWNLLSFGIVLMLGGAVAFMNGLHEWWWWITGGILAMGMSTPSRHPDTTVPAPMVKLPLAVGAVGLLVVIGIVVYYHRSILAYHTGR